jgi:choline kinase
MKAVILAAGQGTRLRPITNDFPKCLVQVNGKPMMQYQLESIARIGIRECVIVVGFKGELIERYFGSNFRSTNLIYIENDRFQETNNLYSLWLASDQLLGDIILLEGDILFHPSLLEEVHQSVHPNLAVVDWFQPSMNGTVMFAKSGFADSVVLKADQFGNFNYQGALKTVNIYRFSQTALSDHILPVLDEWVSKGRTDQFYEATIAQLVAQGHLQLAIHLTRSGIWAEVDTPEDIPRAEKIAASWSN